MSKSVLLEAGTVPLNEIILFLDAIKGRDFPRFKALERDFVSQYKTEVWEEYFNFRLLPSLDQDSSNWLLKQFLGQGN
jgi:hypothetical protein